MKVPAALTREGVFLYRNPDGSTRNEYRPADEVFKADSLASLENAPVTDLHPTTMVNAQNYGALSKGHVCDIKQDGKLVSASALVQDAGLLALVDKGERKEISCGYTCKLDMTPGVSPAGERYDAIQRDIVYNHVALLPVGAGRAGREVALRLDAATQEARTDAHFEVGAKVKSLAEHMPGMKGATGVVSLVRTGTYYGVKLDGQDGVHKWLSEEEIAAAGSDSQPVSGAKPMKMDSMKITFDGKEYDKGSDEHLAAIQAKADADVKTEKARADKAEADKAEADKKLDAAEAPAKAAAREKLETAVRKAIGKPEEKFDGKSDADLHSMIVAAALEVKPEQKTDGNGAARAAAVLATTSLPPVSITQALPSVNPWEQPLAASKK